MMIVFVVVLNIVNDYMYVFKYVRFINILFFIVKIFYIVKVLVDF